MSKTIYKYKLEIYDDKQEVKMPIGATILSVQIQHNEICLWAIVNPKNPLIPNLIYIIGTGNPMPDEVRPEDYVGTVQMKGGDLVGHIFSKYGYAKEYREFP